MKGVSIAIFIFLLFSVPGLAQEKLLWKGVEFGMTSARVIDKVGKPRKDRFDTASFKPALATQVRERKDFRKLTYEKSESWEK